MNKKIVLPTVAVLGTFTLASSSLAFGINNSPYFQIADNLLGGFLGETVGFVEEIYGYVEDVVNSNGLSVLNSLLGDLQSQCQDEGLEEVCGFITREGSSLIDLLSTTTSFLGIPDPLLYHHHIALEIEQSTQLTPWGYYTNNAESRAQIRNAADRGVTKLFAGSLLSEEGQSNSSESIQVNADMAQAGIDTATLAMEATNTQDVMKMIALMQSQQMILAQKTATSTEMNRFDQQIANLNLANISQSIDKQLNQKAVENQIRSDAFIDSLRRVRLF
jgi:hypothetical protein